MHPDNLTVVLGANASFHCSFSEGRGFAWLVTFPKTGDTLDSTNFDDIPQLDKRGIISIESTLIVPAVEGNNNTVIECRIQSRFPPGTTFSYKGSLMILGELIKQQSES